MAGTLEIDVEELAVELDEMMICELCGCSDEYACDGGCEWVQDGLCDRCVDKSEEEGVLA